MTTNNLRPIETAYKGYRFRSRLEARWAVFFDTLGIEWEYEKEGYDLGEAGWYLPDFWLPEFECFVEIKPDIPNEREIHKFSALAKSAQTNSMHRKEHYIICGSPGAPKITLGVNKEHFISVRDGYVCLACAGWLTDEVPDFTISSFAMVNGGTELDVWPLYLTENFLTFPCEITATNIRGSNNDLYTLCLQGVGMKRMYVGKGVIYDSINLRMAYQAARGARFEHGEKGAK